MVEIDHIRILKPPCLSSYQFFLQWFVEACEKAGIKCQENISIPFTFRKVIGKLSLSRHLYSTGSNLLLVPCGGYPDAFVWPRGYFNDIVPVIWDCWPKYWDRVIDSLKRHKVKCAFFTASQVAAYVENQVSGIRCFHLPEGIDCSKYYSGKSLCSRNIDVLEIGRIHSRLHEEFGERSNLSFMFKCQTSGSRLLFETQDDLATGISDSKITICFPRCDTHPDIAGSVETLTQRYWECMLSRTLIFGRAPKELCELIGYNPVIDADWSDVKGQLSSLLKNIRSYQALVDRNYETAMHFASWENRIPYIIECLKQAEFDNNKY